MVRNEGGQETKEEVRKDNAAVGLQGTYALPSQGAP